MPDSARRVKRPRSAPDQTCPQDRRLTRQTSPGNSTTNSGANPGNPFHYQPIPMTTTPTREPKRQNGQTALDFHRPFMDDKHHPK
jgi:hypothetical protein